MRSLMHRPNFKQRGVAAVEFALVLPIIVVLLAFTIFFGRYFWHYNVALKAAHDAAITLAFAHKTEIGISKPDLSEIEIAKVARAVALAEIAELRPGEGIPPQVFVNCDNYQCSGDKVPGEVSVMVRMRMVDVNFTAYTGGTVGPDPIWLYAEVRVPYVGL